MKYLNVYFIKLVAEKTAEMNLSSMFKKTHLLIFQSDQKRYRVYSNGLDR